jgi:hypothetical protein
VVTHSLSKLINLLVAAFCITGCDWPSTPSTVTHEFILPAGYRGVFKVVENKESGQVAKLVNGVVKIVVPHNGIAVLNSTATLKQWHKVIAMSGTGPLSLGVGELLSPESVGFFDLWGDSDGASYYFVGTRAGYDKIQKGGLWEAEKHFPK